MKAAAAGALVLVAAGLAACAPLPPLERGLMFYEEGRYSEAVAAFDEAIQESPESAAAYSNRGAARVRLGDVQEAIDDFTHAFELDPADAELLFNRGNAHVLAADYARAIEDYSGAAALRPPFSRAIFNRGVARARAGDLDGARDDWFYAAEIEPDPRIKAAMQRRAGLTPPRPTPSPGPPEARALADRALDRELAGDRAGAVADLKAALELESDPEHRVGLENMLRLLDGDP